MSKWPFSSPTVLHYKAIPRLQECCRKVEGELVGNSRNKILQTWEQPFRDSLCEYKNVKGVYASNHRNYCFRLVVAFDGDFIDPSFPPSLASGYLLLIRIPFFFKSIP